MSSRQPSTRRCLPIRTTRARRASRARRAASRQAGRYRPAAPPTRSRTRPLRSQLTKAGPNIPSSLNRHALSHEISEWAADPFVNNTVQPWLTPTAPQYGCTGVMETGDPVVGIGFAKGSNTFEQGQTPNGTQVADGYYHPEDEVFMPWFMRLSPSTSQAVQVGTGGRYTFMGRLNPYPRFKMPATGRLRVAPSCPGAQQGCPANALPRR